MLRDSKRINSFLWECSVVRVKKFYGPVPNGTYLNLNCHCEGALYAPAAIPVTQAFMRECLGYGDCFVAITPRNDWQAGPALGSGAVMALSKCHSGQSTVLANISVSCALTEWHAGIMRSGRS